MLLERDQNIPDLAGLMKEVGRIRAVYDAAIAETEAPPVVRASAPGATS